MIDIPQNLMVFSRQQKLCNVTSSNFLPTAQSLRTRKQLPTETTGFYKNMKQPRFYYHYTIFASYVDLQEQHCQLEHVKLEDDFFVMPVTEFKTKILTAFENA